MTASAIGTEYTSTAILAGRRTTGIDSHYIALGKPVPIGFVESFDERMRDEALNDSLLFSLDHARQKVLASTLDYNTRWRTRRSATSPPRLPPPV